MKTPGLFLSVLFAVSFISLSLVPSCGARTAVKIELPIPRHTGDVSVEEAIYKRRSVRDYSDEPLSLGEVSQLIWSAGGMTVDGVTGPTRAYASAGARYPLEIYLVAGNVTSLDAGIYRYDWMDHSLILLREGDFRRDLARASFGQRMIADAPGTIVITTTRDKAEGRYGKRGAERYIYMDAGHLGQNVHLQAEGMGLGTVMVGAYADGEVTKVLGVEDEFPVYIMPVGKPK
jgi:SagB-type dehydrogenase family enzyme